MKRFITLGLLAAVFLNAQSLHAAMTAAEIDALRARAESGARKAQYELGRLHAGGDDMSNPRT